MEIRTNNRILATPSMVQLVTITKPINPLKGGTSLKVIPLPIQTFTIQVQIATFTNELVKGSENFVKE
jgi:hypothetical protein